MTDIFLKIEQYIQLGWPFAVYAKPGNNTLVGVFQKDGYAYKSDDYTIKGFVIAPFAAGETVFIPYENAHVLTANISENESVTAQTTPTETNYEAKNAFEDLVNACISAIKIGDFDKLVASRTETVGTESGTIQIFERLLNSYPNAFRYCFYTKATGLWMGATPEQLLQAQGTTLHTVALAGTQLYNNEQPATWPDKEKQEQQYVTDYIIKELQSHVEGISTSTPYTYRAGNIVHIKTDIAAKILEGNTIKNVIDTLHPTPAVCGLPKNTARDFLIAHEGYNRGYYAGYLGEINHDFETGQPKTDLFVNLRCMKLEDNTAHLYIGCGITKDSNPEKEFIETVNKSMTMKKLL